MVQLTEKPQAGSREGTNAWWLTEARAATQAAIEKIANYSGSEALDPDRFRPVDRRPVVDQFALAVTAETVAKLIEHVTALESTLAALQAQLDMEQ